MRFPSATAAGALAALFALTAQAPAGAPPVVVTWCAFSSWTLAPLGVSGQLPLRFTVAAASPVDDVRFRMVWADGTFTPVDDAGTFAPGSDIRHTLSFDYYGTITGETLQHVNVAIDRVHLANGTTWDAPAAGGPTVRCDNWFGR